MPKISLRDSVNPKIMQEIIDSTKSQIASNNDDSVGVCGRHPKRFWVEVVTHDPDHAPADNPNHVSVASYCALCVNERLSAELKAMKESTTTVFVKSDPKLFYGIACPRCGSGVIEFPLLTIGQSATAKCSVCGFEIQCSGGTG